jgi:hypothetical protein
VQLFLALSQGFLLKHKSPASSNYPNVTPIFYRTGKIICISSKKPNVKTFFADFSLLEAAVVAGLKP